MVMHRRNSEGRNRLWVAAIVAALFAAPLLPIAAGGRAKAATPSQAGAMSTLLRLNRATIDTSKAMPAPPAGLAFRSSPTSWIVQLTDRSSDDQLAGLRAAGLRIVAHGYIPDNGWLVRGR